MENKDVTIFGLFVAFLFLFLPKSKHPLLKPHKKKIMGIINLIVIVVSIYALVLNYSDKINNHSEIIAPKNATLNTAQILEERMNNKESYNTDKIKRASLEFSKISNSIRVRERMAFWQKKIETDPENIDFYTRKKREAYHSGF